MSSSIRAYRGMLLVAAVVLTVVLAACGASGPKPQSAGYQKGTASDWTPTPTVFR